MATSRDEVIKIENKELHFTNLDKVYFPEEGYTKSDVIQYYNSVYDYMKYYLKDRPQSLHRHPNGIYESSFFHKDMDHNIPTWLKTFKVHSDSGDKDINYLICNNKPTLFYMNNLGCIEINPWFSRITKLDYPDYLAIDIDPSDANTFEEVIDVARAVKEVLDSIGAEGYCKTSGATGLHVYIPLNAKYHYDDVKDFALIIASMTLELVPDTSSLERTLSKRGSKIYIDYLQNRPGQTLAAPYSLRPKPGATASAPLNWDEVKSGLHPSQFNIKTLPKRLEKIGDLYRGVLGKGIDMRKCLKNVAG